MSWFFDIISTIWNNIFSVEIPIGDFTLKMSHLWLACFFISFILFPLLRFIFGEGTTSAIQYNIDRSKPKRSKK